MGAKHSSLEREPEWERLRLRDEMRPDFRVLTGNDLAIDMVMYGSDYLLGLSTFAPDLFAERDRLWAAGDPAFYELNDALQHLGNIAFRPPVPAYRHAAAHVPELRGWIASDATPHRRAPCRPPWTSTCSGSRRRLVSGLRDDSAPLVAGRSGSASADAFRARLAELGVDAAFDDRPDGRRPLAAPDQRGRTPAPNRFAILPMEGWDGTDDGRPTDLVRRRWSRFGASGAGLVWGGEALPCGRRSGQPAPAVPRPVVG